MGISATFHTPKLIVLAASVHKLNHQFYPKGSYFIIAKCDDENEAKKAKQELDDLVTFIKERADNDKELQSYTSTNVFYTYGQEKSIASADTSIVGENSLVITATQKNYDYLENRNPIAFFNEQEQICSEPVPIYQRSLVHLNLRIWVSKVGSILYICAQPVAIQINKLGNPNEKGTFKDYFPSHVAIPPDKTNFEQYTSPTQQSDNNNYYSNQQSA